MTINFIGSKSDLISALKKAANVGGIDQMRELAEYIKEEVNLDNLKDQIAYESYRVKVQENVYVIEKVKKKYDSLKNLWIEEECTVVQEIPLFLVAEKQPE